VIRKRNQLPKQKRRNIKIIKKEKKVTFLNIPGRFWNFHKTSFGRINITKNICRIKIKRITLRR
tara:strand:+ start:635 stop:826 length:192 start_codon:yes stop_codon:yes gene_type:complete